MFNENLKKYNDPLLINNNINNNNSININNNNEPY
jgi:hypothetical protein